MVSMIMILSLIIFDVHGWETHIPVAVKSVVYIKKGTAAEVHGSPLDSYFVVNQPLEDIFVSAFVSSDRKNQVR